MRVHFTFNEGDGVQHDGTRDYPDIDAAKREALLALAQSLQEEFPKEGEIVASIAGMSESGAPLFFVSMRVCIKDEVQ